MLEKKKNIIMAGGRFKSRVAKKVDNLAILSPLGMLDVDAKLKNMSADAKSTRSDSDYDSGSSRHKLIG